MHTYLSSKKMLSFLDSPIIQKLNGNLLFDIYITSFQITLPRAVLATTRDKWLRAKSGC